MAWIQEVSNSRWDTASKIERGIEARLNYQLQESGLQYKR